MERKQFEKVSQEFARYANKVVMYKSCAKSVAQFGILKGIGFGANKECFIIVQFGAAHAIHFKDVELPGKRQD